LKALNRAIERFCYRHPKFGIPRLMIYIVLGNAAVYLLSMMDTTYTLSYYLMFDVGQILRGEVWRIITWLFIPMQDNIFFLALSLYFYYFIGSTLEQQWGTPKFTIYYIGGIIFNIIVGTIMWAITGLGFFLSSEYINLSMFFAFAVLFPDMQIMLFFIIPIKVKWIALFDAAYFILQIVFLPGILRLLPVIAILNFLVFCGSDLFSYIKSLGRGRSKQAINFKKAASEARRKTASQPYKHKCSVCGKTDTEYPQLEFRYCSRCEGYHCFCIEHINSHVHFE